MTYSTIATILGCMVFVILVYIIYITILWVSQINHTKEYCRNYNLKYGYASFKIFKKTFDNTDDTDDDQWKIIQVHSDTDLNHKSIISKDIIIMNKIGMLIRNPFEFALVRHYVIKNYDRQLHYNWK
jgi:hypothetical protein